ncbi:MAG: hypothetical protein ACYSX0_16955 [Planctomycetota bacterium]|jgi:hypothetical protein
MERLYELLGKEREFADVCRELKFGLQGVGAPIVGALQVTCSDESEHECVDAFQRRFAQEALPRLKYGSRSPFRIANPGARYEWGTVPIAEDHFATPETETKFKVMVVKINSHVALDRSGQGLCFGTMNRYGKASCYCGAIHALLDGGSLPYLQDLEEALQCEGKDRLATLRDPKKVDPALRPLFAALVSARLQARRATLDIQDHGQTTPTLYLVLHGVTLNKPGLDTELIGGLYTLDRRGRKPVDRYRGLGDDPARYEVHAGMGGLQVSDDQLQESREARDHRALARERLRLLKPEPVQTDVQYQRVLDDVAAGKHKHHFHAKMLFKSLLLVLSGLSPISAAMALFAEGAAHIYHVHSLHRKDYARKVLEQIHEQVDEMPPERAAELIDALISEHGRKRPIGR